MTIPAPTKGIIESENEAFIQPGAAIVQDNWVSTMRGIKLRGGFVRWCELPDAGADHLRVRVHVGQHREDIRRAGHGAVRRDDEHAGAGQGRADQSGNYAAAQFSNQAGDLLLAVNDAGDPVLRYNGVAWEVLDSTLARRRDNLITGPPDTVVRKWPRPRPRVEIPQQAVLHRGAIR